jgi:hypothetical protein
LVELAPGQPGLRLGGAGGRIDLDPLHRREIDHQAVVARAVSLGGMAASAHGDHQAVVTAPPDGRPYVIRVAAARDERREAVDAAVPDHACLLVVGVALAEQLAGERGRQPIDRGRRY